MESWARGLATWWLLLPKSLGRRLPRWSSRRILDPGAERRLWLTKTERRRRWGEQATWMEFHQETLLVYEPDTTEDRRQLVLREQSTNKQTWGHTKDQSRNMVII
jgi:hypothetical protein